MKIVTKEEYYRLARQLQLGNWSTESWDGHTWLKDIPSGNKKVAVRVLSPDHDLLKFDLTPKKASQHIRRIHAMGLATNVSEHAPDCNRFFAGEVIRTERYIDLVYTTVRCLRLREAKQPEHCKVASGLTAHLLMKQALEPEDWDDLQTLWDQYPTAIIEFACYEIPVGVLNRKTIFWEVRDY